MSTASAVVGRRAPQPQSATPSGWRKSAVASWAGMRSVVTVATAIALPMTVNGGEQFPAQQDVVLIALLTVLVTLVPQGPTLSPPIRRLGVANDADGTANTRRLHHAVAEAALERLRRNQRVQPDVLAAVIRQYQSRLRYRHQVDSSVDGDLGGDQAGRQLKESLAHATETEREAAIDARRRGDVSPAAADDVLFDV